MNKLVPPRLVCYTADLKLITGKSDRTCQRLMQQIKDYLGLNKHQQVTLNQISEYLGISLEEILPFIKIFILLIYSGNFITWGIP